MITLTATPLGTIRSDNGYLKINIKVDNYTHGQLIFHRSHSNCKLGFLEYINVLYYLYEKYPKEINKIKEDFFNEIDPQVQMLLLTTLDDRIKRFVIENFQVLSIQSIPIGYDGDIQHHIYIWNENRTTGNGYSERVDKEGLTFKSFANNDKE